ncbi:MAG TPA: hypothetical protein VIG74_04125, partial [Alphaproteobacteria bacterium]
KLTGSKQLVIRHELEPELESGKRRSQRRNITTGLTEELGRVFWRGHLIDVSLGRRRSIDAKHRTIRAIRCAGASSRTIPTIMSAAMFTTFSMMSRTEAAIRSSAISSLPNCRPAYRAYKTANPGFKKDDANTHLQDYAKTNFKKTAHADTIRDRVMTPVDDADAVEK